MWCAGRGSAETFYQFLHSFLLVHKCCSSQLELKFAYPLLEPGLDCDFLLPTKCSKIISTPVLALAYRGSGIFCFYPLEASHHGLEAQPPCHHHGVRKTTPDIRTGHAERQRSVGHGSPFVLFQASKETISTFRHYILCLHWFFIDILLGFALLQLCQKYSLIISESLTSPNFFSVSYGLSPFFNFHMLL